VKLRCGARGLDEYGYICILGFENLGVLRLDTNCVMNNNSIMCNCNLM